MGRAARRAVDQARPAAGRDGRRGGAAGLVAAAALILVGFFFLERRTAAPLVPVEMLRRRPILVANLAAMAVGFAMFALQLATSYFVQSPRASTGFGFGATVLTASVDFLLPGAATGVVIGALVGALVGRVGPRVVLALACVGGALVWLFIDRDRPAPAGQDAPAAELQAVSTLPPGAGCVRPTAHRSQGGMAPDQLRATAAGLADRRVGGAAP